MTKQILIVDDEATIRALVERVMKMKKHETHQAPNGSEAYAHLTSNPVDVIVTDYNMPGGDGLELIQKARQYGFKGPIILYCAQPEENVRKALEAGANLYLEKPSSIMTLAEKVEEFLGE